jgi:hypothetical protein
MGEVMGWNKVTKKIVDISVIGGGHHLLRHKPLKSLLYVVFSRFLGTIRGTNDDPQGEAQLSEPGVDA